MIAQNMPGGLRGFWTVPRRFPRDAFSPAGRSVDIRFDQQDAANFRALHAGLERSHQLHPQFPQSDFPYAHRFFSHSAAARFVRSRETAMLSILTA